MKLVSEYQDNARHARVYAVDAKAMFRVVCELDEHVISRDFYTEQEAEDYAEDLVLCVDQEQIILRPRKNWFN